MTSPHTTSDTPAYTHSPINPSAFTLTPPKHLVTRYELVCTSATCESLVVAASGCTVVAGAR